MKNYSLPFSSHLGSSVRVKDTKFAAIRSKRNSWCYSNSGLGLHSLQIMYQNASDIIASACSISSKFSQCSFFLRKVLLNALFLIYIFLLPPIGGKTIYSLGFSYTVFDRSCPALRLLRVCYYSCLIFSISYFFNNFSLISFAFSLAIFK